MCGILGGNNPEWNYAEGIKIISHRGPDACRLVEFPKVTLAFTRLSIIDLSGKGMQPMTSYDGSVAIVYNGEIYGYQNLKRELAHQYPFQSESDTEVLLYAYMKYGESFVDKIDGMFAIAILDMQQMKLKLYRDRAGIKPLYYYVKDGEFAFASELKALQRACTSVRWNIEQTSVYDYLFLGYVPEPKSIFQNCYKLEPAHVLTYDLIEKKILDKHEYWNIPFSASNNRNRMEQDYCEELQHLVHMSVCDQLVADVPVGTFLSGGVDSSIITYEAGRINPQIRAFTIGFDEPEYDESENAKLLAQKYSCRHHIYMLNNKLIKAVKHRLREWYDEPYADTSAYPSYLISKYARKYVKVVLSGDGGDELFGGYGRYGAYAEIMTKKRVDSCFISFLAKKTGIDQILSTQKLKQYVYTGIENYLPYILPTPLEEMKWYRDAWHVPDDYDPSWYLKKHYHTDLPPMMRARYLDFKTYLPGDILVKMDRVSMSNSLECRVPYLSRAIIEFAFSLPDHVCSQPTYLKKILKNAYRKLIPDEILFDAKRGFSVPPWYLFMNAPTRSMTESILRYGWPDIINIEKG